ncbi:MAG TPA: type II toxin-antitoxin system death-on-curing family toxin [Stackebrandtia sp.]|uniref:type II toxin-antitoxin system death-on-curing family toxin n=1 Tax=Stackebrandtia sp. TaxID=2023065 RepID=UPI002D4D9DDF|nr:type II toxin-antitoxin system death-on-curing family toxin [Stackebrandtia sp.]HZE37643.1 type II toxin-antitoxin system death-on-curing family toxin [Stackebrandtia sp.]
MNPTRYLTLEQLLIVAENAIGAKPLLREPGLLASAAERPATALFGAEQYPTLLDKAAALMHSIARFHPLIDGNKRLAWLAAYTFLVINNAKVLADNDQVFDLTMAVADGRLSEVSDIAGALKPLVEVP